MDVEEAVRRLQEILPLKDRQAKLADSRKVLHKVILGGFASTGGPLGDEAYRVVLGGEDPRQALADLAEKDLIVLADDGSVQGAYPFTTADTPHRVTVKGHTANAMCALDALAVAPMFDTDTVVESSCDLTGARLRVQQCGMRVLSADPGRSIHMGIQWQRTRGAAAHSL